MAHLSGTDRSQLLLLPEAVDDCVGPDNPVRFIDAFVDDLDLVAAGFVRVAAKETGRPGYNPADLLKLYVYGYINRVRSSRRLEAETRRGIEVIWLLTPTAPSARTLHQKLPSRLAAGERIRSRPHGGTTRRPTGHPRSAA
ncbi:transposase [Phyllobacterium salinisoli]|uniref:transposase n=1 Tax=Phyllobacterium salinisoli TaxID=1899321 RepID=UPI002478688B|nr:transposase [Phyllobacterium salinisoli]